LENKNKLQSNEETLIVIKPDGFKRGLTGKDKGFQIKKIKSFQFEKMEAEEFYNIHRDKPFFNELVSFITSGMVVACIIEGNNAVATTRLMIGSTKSSEAGAGTVRGDFGLGLTDNIIHASDSAESFIKESKVIFG